MKPQWIMVTSIPVTQRENEATVQQETPTKFRTAGKEQRSDIVYTWLSVLHPFPSETV